RHRHGDVTTGDDPARAVSAGLTPMTAAEHGAMLAVAAPLLAKHTGDPARRHALEVGYARRRVEWYERLIADEQAAPGSTGTPVDELRAGLAGARARLADVETEAPGSEQLPRNPLARPASCRSATKPGDIKEATAAVSGRRARRHTPHDPAAALRRNELWSRGCLPMCPAVSLSDETWL